MSLICKHASNHRWSFARGMMFAVAMGLGVSVATYRSFPDESPLLWAAFAFSMGTYLTLEFWWAKRAARQQSDGPPGPTKVRW